MEKETVLVIGSTGHQGSKVCDALLQSGQFIVQGTTRKAPNKKLADKGIEAISFKYGDRESIDNAIKVSQATMLFLVTDHRIAGVDNEIKSGKLIIDACKDSSIKHIVFSSVIDCDVCSDKITFFKSKFQIENYLKATDMSYSILRPSGFLENFDDSAMMNPLTKGKLKGINNANAKVEWVACRDIGKAAAVMFQNPSEWKFKTLNLVSFIASGTEIAAILSEVSGTPCQYSESLPKWLMRLVMPGLIDMVDHFEKIGNKTCIIIAMFSTNHSHSVIFISHSHSLNIIQSITTNNNLYYYLRFITTNTV